MLLECCKILFLEKFLNVAEIKNVVHAAEPTDVAVHSFNELGVFSFGLLCPPRKAKNILSRIVIPD